MRVLLLSAAFAALAATSAFADTPPPSGPAPTGQSAPAPATTVAPAKVVANANDPNAVVCKYEQETGSRIPGQKICMTRAQWTQQSADARDNTDQSQTRGQLGQQPMGPP